MSEPRRKTKEQWLYSELPLDDSTPHLNLKAENSHPTKDAYFSHSIQDLFFSHQNPPLMTVGEG